MLNLFLGGGKGALFFLDSHLMLETGSRVRFLMISGRRAREGSCSIAVHTGQCPRHRPFNMRLSIHQMEAIDSVIFLRFLMLDKAIRPPAEPRTSGGLFVTRLAATASNEGREG